ncbi:MAG: NmrA family NAD(P)-binding protein [Steroidobacteraceae bacterium]
MIVVTTPTGDIGSKLVKSLLAAKESVRVIARDPARIAPEMRDQVEIVQGSTDDEAVWMRALEGAESVFLVVPPDFATNNINEHYLRFTRPACKAMTSRGVKRIVSVSGLGRGIQVNAGLVTAAFVKDAEIERRGVDFRALWCPGFMENLLRQVPRLTEQGLFSGPGRPDVKAPQVSTRDIAASAAKLLLDRSWTGRGGLAVLGPEDLSINDMAAIMTEVLGKPIRNQTVPAEAYKAQLMARGASEAFAQGLVEMYAAKDNGLDNHESRTAENTTPTTFRQWCNEVLKPAVCS